ncbi:hypothetical protein SteCoe_2962 [Stentor coeruleus]|uniref:Uncharacterized protein n=1 Tax=Stentor coeruleus TaxID=5963 RepID=A0A1R2CY70_9CILI|nr:hypothetical protein SteCoe_2962 [Stentor coeruleus]
MEKEDQTVIEGYEEKKQESKPQSNNYEYFLKVVLAGDAVTGKSSLLMRYSNDTFSESYFATIGIEFRIKEINIENKAVKLQLWDTSGQERFRAMISSYYKGAHCILILYDSSNRESFVNLVNWIGETENYAMKNSIICLIEHEKCDRVRDVGSFEGEEYARRHNLLFFKVNAKTNEGVNELFEKIALKAVEKIDSEKTE